MPRPPEMLALHLLKPDDGSAMPFGRAMPHIHVTHPCAPDSPNGLDNPIFIVEDEMRRNYSSDTENLVLSSGTSPIPTFEAGSSNYLTLTTHSLPVSPIPYAWDQLSCVSTPSRSISETSSSMAADKGLYIYEKIHAIVLGLTQRANRVKGRIMQPPTPSSLGSERSRSPSLEFANRHRFESFVTFTSSIQSNSHRYSNDDVFVKKHDWKIRCVNFWKSSFRCPKRRCVDPQSRFYILWLALVSICYMYNSWAVILRASFPYQTPENLHIWLICDYTSDLLYFLDLVVFKPHTKILQDGFWITDPRKTSRIYYKSWTFVLNTFWEFFERFDRIAKLPHIIRIMHTLTYMLFLIHVNACSYYAYSAYEGIGRPDNVWVYNGEGNAYIRCFLFATKIATSIGKNPTPTHEGEYMFMTISWLSGVFIFAMLIGQIRDILSVASQNEEEYRRIMDRTLVYMKRLNLMKEFHDRARLWFTYNWQQQKSLDEHKSLKCLPHKMQMDIAMYVHFNILSKVKLFQDFDRNLLRELVLKLKPYLYLPGDYICQKGEVGKDMYIVNYGRVEVMGGDNDDVVMATLIEGSVFGEISLLSLGYGNRRTADVRSKGFSNLFVLSKADLHSTIKDYPLAQDILRHRAKRLIKASIPKEREDYEEVARNSTPKLLQTVLQVVAPESLTAQLFRHSTRSMRSYPRSAPPHGPRVVVSTASPHPQSPDFDLSEDKNKFSNALVPTPENGKHSPTTNQESFDSLQNSIISDSSETFDDPHRDYSSRSQSGALYDVEAYLQSDINAQHLVESQSTVCSEDSAAESTIIVHESLAPDHHLQE